MGWLRHPTTPPIFPEVRNSYPFLKQTVQYLREATGSRPIAFYNPERIQFSYDLLFLGRLNRAPAITTIPVVEVVAGRPYRYDADATDPDDDTLVFSLPSGPVDAVMDSVTGVITWNPKVDDVGNHTMVLRVEDGRGGTAEQHYVLSVLDAQPNRPPSFTSVPVVDAYVNVDYSYRATATDPDDDPLTFAPGMHPAAPAVEVRNPGFEAPLLNENIRTAAMAGWMTSGAC